MNVQKLPQDIGIRSLMIEALGRYEEINNIIVAVNYKGSDSHRYAIEGKKAHLVYLCELIKLEAFCDD